MKAFSIFALLFSLEVLFPGRSLGADLLRHQQIAAGSERVRPTAAVQSAPTLSIRGPRFNISQNPSGTTWEYVSIASRVTWDRPGGDWSDKNGTRYGETPFGTGIIKLENTRQRVSIDVKDLVEKLRAENTGIILRTLDRGYCKIFGKDVPAGSYGPALQVKTDQGAWTLSPTIATWIAKSAGRPVGNVEALGLPALLKFDLSAIAGAIESATLEVTNSDQFFKDCVIGAFYIETPVIFDSPAKQLPKRVRTGLSAKYKKDTDLASDPDVIFYSEFKSLEQMAKNRTWWPTEDKIRRPEFVFDPKTGTHRLRLTLVAGDHIGASTRHRIAWTAENYATGARPAPTELYVRWRQTFGKDTGNIDGVKQPGIHAMFENGPYPPGMEYLGKHGSSLRTEHEKNDPDNPEHLGHFTYAYVPGLAGTGSGVPWRTGEKEHFAIRKGQTYDFEQYVKFNSFDATGKAIPDGIYELYVDGVLLYSDRALVLRTDPRIAVEDVLWINIYHGGRAVADHDATYEIGPVVAAKSYIGPTVLLKPKK